MLAGELLKTEGQNAGRLGDVGVVNLDANANTAATPAVCDAVMAALEAAGNPSSTHEGGAVARRILAEARDAVSALVHGSTDETVVFTSGCTEANNTVLYAALATGAAIITSAIEHPSVLAVANALMRAGVTVRTIGVDANGIIDLPSLETAIVATAGPIIVSVQSANSETGVIQPIPQIAALLKGRADTLFHSDAAQAFGKVPVHVGARAPDVVTISGHKVHAPMGVGAIITAQNEDRVAALLHGGDQQGGRRAGTEPVALIAGMAAACSARASTMLADVHRMRTMRDRLERSLTAQIPGAKVNGVNADRLPNTSSVTFLGLDGMALVAQLDAEGIMVSQGSACSSMRPTPSHVLTAMGMTEADAFSTIRFAVSPLNTIDEVDAAIAAVIHITKAMGASL